MKTTPANPSDIIQRREQRWMLLLMSPALLVIVVLLLIPLGWLAWQSVYDGGFTSAHYSRIWNDTVYWNTFALTFRISITVTVLTLLLGYPVAYLAVKMPYKWAMVVLAMVVLPFWTSVLVRAYAWLILLQRTGLINEALVYLGIADGPLKLVHNELGTVIATVHILLPFMVLPLYAAMKKIPDDLTMAASSLGARPSMAFWRVFMPLSLSGVLAGATLVFVLCLGFYITPELMGGGRTIMVSMVVARNVELYNQWGAASAVSIVLLLCVLAVFYIVSRVVPLDRILAK